MNENKITNKMLTEIRPELDAAVAEVAKKYGVTIRFGNARFSDLNATFTVEMGIAPSDSFDPARAEWERNCRALGLEPEDFGKEFCFIGEKVAYRICGYNPKGRTNNIRIKRVSDGKEFITNAMSVKAGLGKLQAEATTPPAPEEIQKEKEEEARKAKMEWDLNCWRIGMKKEDFGKVVVLDGHLFRICGFLPNAKKNDIRILDVKRNKEYVSSHDTIKKALNGSTGQ